MIKTRNINTLNTQQTMAAPTGTGAKRKIVYNPYCMLITPFTGEAKGSKTYRMEDIVRDTTSVSQEDNTENKTENEYGSAPIANSITLGSYTFATEIGDMQEDLMKDIAGFVIDPVSKKAYASGTYKEVFAEITLVFESGGTYVAAILPKVQLNSKVTIDSISTSPGRITVAGTGFMLEVTDGSNKYPTPFILDYDYTLPV